MDKMVKTPTQRDANLTLHQIYKKFKGGHVLRYHTRPELADGQNVAAHSWRAMVILHTLWPDISKNALLHMMYHDVAEGEVGDIPATTKWKYTEFAQMLERLEQEYETSLGIGKNCVTVTVDEKHLCNMADKLELVMHCFRLMQRGNNLARDVYQKGRRYLIENYQNHEEFIKVEEVLNELTHPEQLETSLDPILQKLHQL